MGSFGVSPRVGPSGCRSTPTHGPVTKPFAQRVVAQVISFCSGWPGKWVRLVIPPKLFAPAGSGAIGGRYFRGGPVVLVVRHVVILPLSEIARGGVDSELRRRQWTGRKGVVSSELPVMVRPAAPGYAALASDGMHWTTCGRRPRGTGCGRGIARSSRLLRSTRGLAVWIKPSMPPRKMPGGRRSAGGLSRSTAEPLLSYPGRRHAIVSVPGWSGEPGVGACKGLRQSSSRVR